MTLHRFLPSRATVCPSKFKLQLIARVLPAILTVLVIANPAATQMTTPPEAPYVADEIIVKFAPAATPAAREAVYTRLSTEPVTPLKFIGAEVVRVTTMSVEDAVDSLLADPAVEWAEPNYIWTADAIPDDPEFDKLWGMHNTGQTGGTPDADIDAPEAWNVATGGDVLIAIIDTGIDSAHVDLRPNIWHNPGEIPGNGVDDDGNGYVDDVYGWDFYNGDNDPYDDNGHGSHCAGTIAGVGNNGIGVAGVCWTAQLMGLKFLSSGGSGPTSAAVLALEYATMMGVKVTSNSWGGGGYSQALKDAIDSAGAHGFLFVAAAGNAGVNNDINPHYPSSYTSENIISVAATNHNDLLANEGSWGSNYGAVSVDLGAPGVSIYSVQRGGGYTYKSGTSMATPHVSGAVGLIWSRYPAMPHMQVKQRLMDFVDTLPDLAGKCVSEGRLNLLMSIADPDSTSPSPITDLAVVGTEGTRVALQWTATGDDSTVGRAAYYDLRYALAPIDAGNFDAATPASGEPAPSDYGTPETFTVTGLDFDTEYYFALAAYDEWGNSSGVSNSPSGTTLGPPLAAVTPESIVDSLFYNGSSTHELTLSNSGEGELFFSVDVSYPAVLTTDVTLTIPAPVTPTSGEAAMAGASPSPAEPTTVTLNGVSVAATGLNVLLVYADLGASSLQSILSSFPDMSSVDAWYAGAGGGTIPTLGALEAYDVVVAWNNEAWANMYAIGDVLADYIDAGGAVVATVDCWSAGSFASHGRYFDVDGYCPFNSLGGALFNARTLGWYDATHPVMEGVTSLATSSFYNNTVFTAGAEEVARWDDGTPLVGTNPQTVAINVWPGDGYYWSGDFPTLIHNAILYAQGTSRFVSVEPQAGEVAPFSDSILTVELSPKDIVAGDYEAFIGITTNDPLNPELTVPVSLHITGAPDIAFDPDSLEFGIVYVGYPESLDLVVKNDGTDSLYVTNISSVLADISVDVTSFAIEAKTDTVIHVTLAPAAAGPVDAVLTFESNDPDEATFDYVVRAEALDPPDVVVAPDSLVDSLYTGETSTHTLNLFNAGLSDLAWSIDIREVVPGSLATAIDPYATRLDELKTERRQRGTVSAVAASGRTDVPVTAEASGTSLALLDTSAAVLIIQNDYPWGSHAIDDILTAFGVTVSHATVGAFDALNLSDYDVIVIPSVQTSSFYSTLASKMGVLESYVSGGGVLEYHATSYSSVPSVPLPGGGTSSYSPSGQNQIVAPEHPIAAGIPAVVNGNWANHNVLNGLPVEALVIATDMSAGATCAEYPIGRGLVIVTGMTWEFAWGAGWDYADMLPNALAYALESAQVPWVTVDSTEGVLAAGTGIDLDVIFDAAGLYGGDYLAEIAILSNDPARPEVAIPAHLNVTGAPDIAVAPDTLDYDSVYITAERTLELTVSNVGTDVLTVTDITSSHGDFTPDITAFTLAPQEHQSVMVAFTPTTPGVLSGELQIASDDVDEGVLSVWMTGIGVEPPDIAVAPDSLGDSLLTGEMSTHVLTVSNTGVHDLIFSTSIRDLATPAAAVVFDTTEVPLAAPLGVSENCLSDCASTVTFEKRVYSIPGADADTPNILLMEGSCGPDFGFVYENALSNLGLPHTFVTSFPALITALTDGTEWDLVIVNAYGSSPTPEQLDAIDAYQVAGGRLIYADWSVEYNASHPLFEHMGIAFVASVFEPENFAAVAPAHRIFTSPNATASWRATSNNCNRDGQYTTVLSGATQLAAYASDPVSGTIVLNADKNCLFNGFQSDNFRADDDGDGKNDILELVENEISFMANFVNWLTVAPESGIVPSGSSIDVVATFDATGLYGGDYLASIDLASNDPDTPIFEVPASLHVTGAPDMVVTPDSLDYDTVYVTASAVDTVWVQNVGTDLLTISSIVSDYGDFTATPTTFGLNPTEQMGVAVTFAPTTPGPIAGTLTITGDDPLDPTFEVALRGIGLEPPDIAVTPDSLGDSLFTGEVSTHTLTISNDGASNLHFAAGIAEWPPPALVAGVVGSIADGLTSIRDGMRATRAAGATGTNEDTQIEGPEIALATAIAPAGIAPEVLLIADVWPWGYSEIDGLLDTLGAVVSYATSNYFDTLNLGQFDLIVILSAQSSTFYSRLASKMAVLEAYVSAGGIIELHACSFGDVVALPGGGSSHFRTSSQNTVVAPDHPIVEGVPGIVHGSSASHNYLSGLPAGAEVITVDLSGDPTTAEYSMGSGLVIVTGMTWEFAYHYTWDFAAMMPNALAYALSSRVSWISVAPDTGTVAAGAAVDLTVTFDAAGMYGGDYLAAVKVFSNDPDEPEVTVPASLHVTGAPDIAVAPDSLEFDSVFITANRTLSVTVRNDGTDLLTVTGITSTHGDYSADPTTFALAPTEEQTVEVTFAPTTPGVLSGELQIASDDVDEPVVGVWLTGIGVEPPDIAVAPDSLGDSLLTGQQSIHTLTVSNEGVHDLIFAVSVNDLTPSGAVVFDTTEYPLTAPAEVRENCLTDCASTVDFEKRVYSIPGAEASDLNILLMEASCGSGFNYFYDQALGNLGLPRTFVTSFAALRTALTDTVDWDLVIVNSYGGSAPTDVLTALDTYQAAGGHLIYADWYLEYYATHPLVAHMGVEFVASIFSPVDFTTTKPLHRIFTTPNMISQLHPNSDGCARDGQFMNVLPGATQLAAYDGNPTTGAIVLNADENCLFNAFQADNFRADDDGDGKADMLELAENEISFMATTLRWLSVEPVSGVVPSGGSIDLAATFDATGMYGGDYLASVDILSNDPDEPTVSVPASLHVTGAPDITVSPDSLDFGRPFLGATVQHDLIISNIGTDLLTVSDIASDHPYFTPSVTSVVLAPEETGVVVVSFVPTDTGAVTATLTITSDDPDESVIAVPMNGEGLLPPELVVSPVEIRDSLYTGQSAIHPITIGNTGYSDLVFSLWEYDGAPPPLVGATVTDGRAGDRDGELRVADAAGTNDSVAALKWLHVPHITDTVPPGEELTIDVELDAYQAYGWDYEGYVAITTNDPLASEFDVPVYLHVIGAPDIMLHPEALGWDSAFVGKPQVLDLEVFNVGTDTLHVVNITSDDPDFVPDKTSFAIRRFLSTHVGVTFTPSHTGAFSATLTIESDDPDEPTVDVPLTGFARLAPNAVIRPDSIWVSLTDIDSTVEILTIENTGLGDLNWQLESVAEFFAVASVERGDRTAQAAGAAPVVSVSPTAGVVAPGESQDLEVAINSRSLGAGDHHRVLGFKTNDPVALAPRVPLTIHVFYVRRGDTYPDDLINSRDILYLAWFLFREWPEPPFQSGDVNCDGGVTIVDLTYLIDYIFRSGPNPGCH